MKLSEQKSFIGSLQWPIAGLYDIMMGYRNTLLHKMYNKKINEQTVAPKYHRFKIIKYYISNIFFTPVDRPSREWKKRMHYDNNNNNM